MGPTIFQLFISIIEVGKQQSSQTDHNLIKLFKIAAMHLMLKEGNWTRIMCARCANSYR